MAPATGQWRRVVMALAVDHLSVRVEAPTMEALESVAAAHGVTVHVLAEQVLREWAVSTPPAAQTRVLSVEVMYHVEANDDGDLCVWAESPQLRRFTAAGSSLSEVRELVIEAIEFEYPQEDFVLSERISGQVLSS